MRFSMIIVVGMLSLCSCRESKKKNIPDVSHITAPLAVERFDRMTFASYSGNVDSTLNQLSAADQSFLGDYLYNILGLPPVTDSVRRIFPLFLRDYKAVYDSVQVHYSDEKLAKAIEPLKLALQLSKHYFPDYKAPEKLITYVGPVDGYGTVLTRSGIAVGLQLYLGADFPMYRTDYVRQVYPDYASKRFVPEYIPVNAVKSFLDEITANGPKGKNLIERMVDVGKNIYILSALLPNTEDSLLLGYSAIQLQGCTEHEADIWNFFVENNFLFSNDPTLIRDYLNDGPNTPTLGENAPANIGEYIGWKIVEKWMSTHDNVTLPQLVDMSPDRIFKESRYKPH